MTDMSTPAMSYMVFDRALLSAESGYIPSANSDPVPAAGNTLVVFATIMNWVGSVFELDFQIEGSYDGLAWITLGSVFKFTASPPGTKTSAAVTVLDVAWVRLRATVPTTGSPLSQVVFSAVMVFSDV